MPRTATASKTTARAPRKSAAEKGAEQHANGENLKAEGTSAADDLTQRAAAIQAQVEADRKAGMPAVPPASFVQGEGFVAAKLNDANLQAPRIGHSVLVSSIVKAAGSFKAAITLECAVGLAVFTAANSSSKQAKKELYSVYKEAGYDCDVGGGGKDYKTVNRRIGYVAQFFDSLKVDDLNAIMGETKGEEALTMLVNWLGNKFIFRSMNDVLTAAGVTPPSQVAKDTNKGQTSGDAGGGTEGGNKGQGGDDKGGNQPPAGGGSANETAQSPFQTSATATPLGVPQAGPSEADKGVMAAMQQEGQKREQTANEDGKFMKFTFEGATLLIPADYKVECLTELSLKLQLAAHHMKGKDTVDAEVLNAEFTAVAAAH